MGGWSELKSVSNIQVFIRFANFYQRFIQGFSKIAAFLTSMLKILADNIDGAKGDRRQNRSKEKISKTSKSKSTKSFSKSRFLSLKAKISFIWLKQAVIEILILQ